jgi:hypothetical protein
MACNQRTDCFLSQNMFKTSDYMPPLLIKDLRMQKIEETNTIHEYRQYHAKVNIEEEKVRLLGGCIKECYEKDVIELHITGNNNLNKECMDDLLFSIKKLINDAFSGSSTCIKLDKRCKTADRRLTE